MATLGNTFRSIRSHTLVREPRFSVGVLILCVFILMAALAPVLAPFDPIETDYDLRFEKPTWSHPLGTDEYGRDILSRLIYGARISLFVSSCSLLLATTGGVLLGLLGAFGGRIFGNLTMRLVDALLCIPPIFMAIAVVAFVGGSLFNLIIIMGLLYMPQFARLAYTSCLSVKENEYVEAAQAVGCTLFRIIRKYILPNILSPIIVQASFSLGALILLESGLSFLGLGVMPPTPSWGVMLGTAKSYLYINGLLILWPALAIAVVVLTINMMGDGLRDALDPRARKIG